MDFRQRQDVAGGRGDSTTRSLSRHDRIIQLKEALGSKRGRSVGHCSGKRDGTNGDLENRNVTFVGSTETNRTKPSCWDYGSSAEKHEKDGSVIESHVS